MTHLICFSFLCLKYVEKRNIITVEELYYRLPDVFQTENYSILDFLGFIIIFIQYINKIKHLNTAAELTRVDSKMKSKRKDSR